MEVDEAGRLRAFREKFGRGWDAERMDLEDREGEEGGEQREESLMDLITGFVKDDEDGREGGKNKEARDRLEREQQEVWDKKAADSPVKKKGGNQNPNRR